MQFRVAGHAFLTLEGSCAVGAGDAGILVVVPSMPRHVLFLRFHVADLALHELAAAGHLSPVKVLNNYIVSALFKIY